MPFPDSAGPGSGRQRRATWAWSWWWWCWWWWWWWGRGGCSERRAAARQHPKAAKLAGALSCGTMRTVPLKMARPWCWPKTDVDFPPITGSLTTNSLQTRGGQRPSSRTRFWRHKMMPRQTCHGCFGGCLCAARMRWILLRPALTCTRLSWTSRRALCPLPAGPELGLCGGEG